MSSNPDPITRAAAEQLLRGTHEGAHDLAALLRDAASDASASEVAGVEQALVAFRAARLATSPPRTHWRRSMLKTALAQLVAAKFAATAALAAAATGGIALAAATNSLPTPLQHAAHNAFGAPNAHASGHAVIPSLPGAATSHSSHASHSESSSDTTTSSSAATSVPSPSLVGLCHAYEAGVATSNGKALDNPAFMVLITAAGGRDNVVAYCATVLPSDTPSPHGPPSTHAEHPSGGPTDLPSQAHGQPSSVPAHSTGKPSDLPSHPNGPPTSVPARH